MHMARPEDDILQHCNVIDSAFQHILYYLDLALLFAYFLGPFVIIPVGMVFRARNAPSYFSLTSDIRANVATSCDLHGHPPLAIPVAATDVARLPMDWSASRFLAFAKQDARTSPLTLLEQSTDGHSMFVDDNGVAADRSNIWRALHQSIELAYMLYGYIQQTITVTAASAMVNGKSASTTSWNICDSLPNWLAVPYLRVTYMWSPSCACSYLCILFST
jgi:hypothetical protein